MWLAPLILTCLGTVNALESRLEAGSRPQLEEEEEGEAWMLVFPQIKFGVWGCWCGGGNQPWVWRGYVHPPSQHHFFFQDWWDKADDKNRSSSYCLGIIWPGCFTLKSQKPNPVLWGLSEVSICGPWGWGGVRSSATSSCESAGWLSQVLENPLREKRTPWMGDLTN